MLNRTSSDRWRSTTAGNEHGGCQTESPTSPSTTDRNEIPTSILMFSRSLSSMDSMPTSAECIGSSELCEIYLHTVLLLQQLLQTVQWCTHPKSHTCYARGWNIFTKPNQTSAQTLIWGLIWREGRNCKWAWNSFGEKAFEHSSDCWLCSYMSTDAGDVVYIRTRLVVLPSKLAFHIGFPQFILLSTGGWLAEIRT